LTLYLNDSMLCSLISFELKNAFLKLFRSDSLVSMFCEEFEIDDMDKTGVFEYLLEHYKAEALKFGDGLYEYTVPHRFAHCIVNYNGRLSESIERTRGEGN